MIYSEKLSSNVDRNTSLIENIDCVTMYNILCNTINRKRIYENPDIPEVAIKRLLKIKRNNIEFE